MVGVSVFLINEKNQILVGKRAEGTWGLPGGGMEAGETPKETAVRETLEETAVDICEGDLRFATFTNDVFLKTKNEHWITRRMREFQISSAERKLRTIDEIEGC